MTRARSSRAALSFGLAVGIVLLRSTVFVPPPSVGSAHAKQASLAACAATVLGAAGNAHADAIGDAAAKLSKAAYPFMKEVPWNSGIYNLNPGTADAVSWTKAIGKMIAMGAAMDSKLLAAGADAHHKAIQGLPANGVCSEAQLTAINAAIGRLIASVPESTTMDVYNSVTSLVDPKVPQYLMSTVKEADAKAAYAALVDFTNVVKANPITPSSPASTVSSSAAASISAASSKLSAAAYPFMKDIDWTDQLYSKPVPGKTPQEAMKAIDKMIVMGSKMDGAALKEAAAAHAKAIQNMDAKGVLTQADFEAINTGLGKAIASAGTAATMDVYNEMAKLAGSSPVPNYLFSKVNPQDAVAAYNGLMEFKDVVKAAQR
jgi:hypothetical protein